jgi:cell division protein FtsL
MNKTDEKIKVKRFFGSRLFLIIGIPLALLIVFSYVRSYYSGYKVNQEIAALERDIKTLEHKKLESMEILDYVMSSVFVEEKARTELNMKKEGENILVFKNENAYSARESYKDNSTGQKISNPLKWWYYFINKNQVINN